MTRGPAGGAQPRDRRMARLVEFAASHAEVAVHGIEALARCDDADVATNQARMPCSWIEGVPYPLVVQEPAVRKAFSEMPFRAGDVIFVSNFPASGVFRMATGLVRGDCDMWSPGLVGPESWLEVGASLFGPDLYIQNVSGSRGRRLFQTRVLPSLFPVDRLVEASAGAGVAPKVVVMIADPRFAMTAMREALQCKFGVSPNLEHMIEVDVKGRFRMWGNYLLHGLAWGQEAARHPEQIRLFAADRFCSWDPKEVRAAVLELAEFLEVSAPEQLSDSILATNFRPPPDVASRLQQDLPPAVSALRGGPLLDLLGPGLRLFEETLMEMRAEVRHMWNASLVLWREASDPLLSSLGYRAAGAAASLPPARRLMPMRGEAAHRAGTCRPCLFALRGTCRNSAEMCAFCHEDGHVEPKRASQKKRAAQQRRRLRTPSPDR